MEGALSAVLTGFDVVLALTLVAFAVLMLRTTDIFEAIVLFIAFGLLMALTWTRLDAVDVALAEAAIGAGLTGALFLNARAHLLSHDPAHAAPDQPDRRVATTDRRDANGRDHERRSLPLRLGIALAVAPLAAALAYALIGAPTEGVGLTEHVDASLESSGVASPVTAVLLSFRAYDTLLELAVLLLAVIATWSLRLGPGPARAQPPPGSVLTDVTRWLVPVVVLAAGYLLWRGAHAPGGAFQAGAVLAGAGVLLALGERRLGLPQRRWMRRLGLAAGVLAFASVGLGAMSGGAPFLFHRGLAAKIAIVGIELTATIAIALALVALFSARAPRAPSEGRR